MWQAQNNGGFMTLQDKNQDINMERYTQYLKNVLQEVRTHADPAFMNKLKKTYKNVIPIGMRSYVGAYLAKLLSEESNFSENKANNEHTRQSYHTRKYDTTQQSKAQRAKEQSSPTEREIQDPSLTTSIFISVGRICHTNENGLRKLLCEQAKIDAKKIGEVNVMPKYSFVQLSPEDAQKAIDVLNGTKYKNRTITVSHSVRKASTKQATDNNNSTKKPALQEAQTQAN